MKIRNEKGFTLVEMIAAVAIMGVLSGTVISGVTGSINKSHQEYCSSNEGMLVIAGRDYFNDHRSFLPSVVGEQNCVDLDTLEKENYIDPMTDYKENACNKKESKVCGLKVTGTSFYYAPYLSCGACITQNTRKENTSSPVITFIKDGGTNKKNQDIVVTMNIADSKNEITSYSYTVYQKTDGGDIPIKTVDWREYKKDKKITIRLNQKGTFYIEGRAYNSIGRNTIKKSKEYVLEYTLPSDCENQISVSAKKNGKNGAIAEKTWINESLYIYVTKSGAVESYDIYVNGEKIVDLGTESTKRIIYDEKQTSKYEVEVIGYNDQQESCKMRSYHYYQDNIAPSCESIGSPNQWVNTNVTLKAKCSDEHSGCNGNVKDVKNLLTKDQNKESTAGTVYDKAGNKTECKKVLVQIDKTPPTKPSGAIGKVSGSDKNGSIQTLASGSVDTGSGFQEYRYLITNTENIPTSINNFSSSNTTFTRSCGTSYYAWVVAVDKVGNISQIVSLGSTSDQKDKYSDWSACSASCGGGTQTRTNSCELITHTKDTPLEQECNTQSCKTASDVCNYRGNTEQTVSRYFVCDTLIRNGRSRKHGNDGYRVTGTASDGLAAHGPGSQYYIRYCVNPDGYVYTWESAHGSSDSKVCANSSCPLGTLDNDGWIVISDEAAKNHQYVEVSVGCRSSFPKK